MGLKKEPIPHFRFRETKTLTRDSMLLAKGQLPQRYHQSLDLDDASFRAAESCTINNRVLGSNLKYSPSFESKVPVRTVQSPGAPGFLEYEETPRRKPSLAKAVTRPATSIIGAETELNYKSTFESHYRWPEAVEKQIYGGSIHSSLDNYQGLDKFGKFPVFENSIAKSMLKVCKIPNAVFTSCKPVVADSDRNRLEYRTRETHPTSIADTVEKSPLKLSCMTKERSSTTRFKHQFSEGHNVRYYDYNRSGPLADLSVLVEKSPIRYSIFHSSPTKIFHRKPLLDLSTPDRHDLRTADDVNIRVNESTTSHGVRHVSHRHDAASAERFPRANRPGSMLKAPVCHNEKCEVEAKTISATLKQTGLSYSAMRSSVGRSSPEDQSFGLSVQCPGLRASRSLSQTEFYDGVSAALPDPQKPIAAFVEHSGRNYAVFSSAVGRLPPPSVSIDPTVPLKHETRRQHLLQARITAIREHAPGPSISKKLKRILNLD